MSVTVVHNEFPERGNLSSSMCRACLTFLTSKITTHNIFAKWEPDFVSRSTTMAIEMEQLTHTQITHEDGFSQDICNVCYDRLCTALMLVADLNEATAFFAKKTKASWPRPIEWNKDINGEVLKPSQDVEIKKEIMSDNEFDDDCEPIEVPIMDIKIEPEEITGQGYNPKVKCNGTISIDQHKKLSSVADVESDHSSGYLEDYMKQEPMSDDEEILDMSLECMLCAKKFRTVSGLKAHVITRHNYMRVKRKLSAVSSPIKSDLESHSPAKRKDPHICTTCRRSFQTSTDLKVHETCHRKTMCYKCDGKFGSFQEMAKHVKKCSVQQKPVQHKTLDDAIRERKRTNTVERETHNGKRCNPEKINDDAKHKKDINEIHKKKKHTDNEEHETMSSDCNIRQNQEDTDKKIAEDKRTEEKYNKIETELDSIFEFVKEIKVPNEKNNIDNETIQETLEKNNEVVNIKEPLAKEDNEINKREMEVEISMEELHDETGKSNQSLEHNNEIDEHDDSKDNVETQDESSQHIAPIEKTFPEKNENSVLEDSLKNGHINAIDSNVLENKESSVNDEKSNKVQLSGFREG